MTLIWNPVTNRMVKKTSPAGKVLEFMGCPHEDPKMPIVPRRTAWFNDVVAKLKRKGFDNEYIFNIYVKRQRNGTIRMILATWADGPTAWYIVPGDGMRISLDGIYELPMINIFSSVNTYMNLLPQKGADRFKRRIARLGDDDDDVDKFDDAMSDLIIENGFKSILRDEFFPENVAQSRRLKCRA